MHQAGSGQESEVAKLTEFAALGPASGGMAVGARSSQRIVCLGERRGECSTIVTLS